MNKLPCNCTTSPFTDANHGHIVSGDIRIVQNNKLRKLLCKGPKYREPVSINFSKCQTEIKNSLTKFSSDWCNRKGVPVTCFTQWISITRIIRVSIKSFKKSFLKHICNDVYDFLSSKADSFPNQQWYEMTLDLIESRLYNPPAPKTTKTKPKT